MYCIVMANRKLKGGFANPLAMETLIMCEVHWQHLLNRYYLHIKYLEYFKFIKELSSLFLPFFLEIWHY